MTNITASTTSAPSTAHSPRPWRDTDRAWLPTVVAASTAAVAVPVITALIGALTGR